MNAENIKLEEQIERCRRLRTFLTDGDLRDALEGLAEDYEARLRRRSDGGEGFMLRNNN